MKRQRSNAEKSTTDHAAATGKSSRKIMRSKVVGADPDHHQDGGGGGATGNMNTASTCAAAAAAAAVAAAAAERECYLYNGGHEGVDHHRGVLDYEQMWWGSIWLPSFDVEHYMVDDAVAVAADDDGGDVLWDIDDIWNLKSIK